MINKMKSFGRLVPRGGELQGDLVSRAQRERLAWEGGRKQNTEDLCGGDPEVIGDMNIS